MRKTMVLACVLGLAFATRGLAGEVEKAEAAVKDIIKLMKDFTGILKKMTDEDTVKAATSKLKAVDGRRKEVFKKLESLKDLPKEDKQAIREKYDKEVQSLKKALKAEAERVAELPGGKDALKLVGPFFAQARKEQKEEKKNR